MVTNGRIDMRQLALVDATHYASPGCTVAFHAFSAAMGGLTVHNEADSAYRSLAWQQYRWNLHASNPHLYPVAAPPGHSNHGLGQAIDIGNYYRFAHKDLARVGSRFGFTFDTPSEAWHIRFTGDPAYHPITAGGVITTLKPPRKGAADVAATMIYKAWVKGPATYDVVPHGPNGVPFACPKFVDQTQANTYATALGVSGAVTAKDQTGYNTIVAWCKTFPA